jgi:hypothetical protein
MKITLGQQPVTQVFVLPDGSKRIICNGGCGVFLPPPPLPKRVLAATVIQYAETYIYVYILQHYS